MSLLHLSTKSRFCMRLASPFHARQNLSHARSFTNSRTSLRIVPSSPNAIATGRLVLSFQRNNRWFSTTTTTTGKSNISNRNNVAKFFNRDAAKTGDASRHAAKTTGLKSKNSQRWARVAWFVRVFRIPALIGSLYSLGYQQGVLDSVRNPNKIQQRNFESCCMDMGITSGDEIDIIWERRPPGTLAHLGFFQILGMEEESGPTVKDPRVNKVAKIGRDIIRSARQYIREKLNFAVKKKQEELTLLARKESRHLSKEEIYKAITEDEEVQKWTESYERIEGYTEDGIKNWQFILLQSPVPNAFVTEMLPQRVFVTSGLFDEFVTSDEELAMILGHELSHLVLGHGKERLMVDFMLRGLEIAILMLDPTEGLLSLGVAGFLASTREALTANQSRFNECEADELGCTFAAMACYDTRSGSEVFRRMHEYDVANNNAKRDIMSSHPASNDRYEFVKKLSEEVNRENYSVCGRLDKKLRGRALSLLPGFS